MKVILISCVFLICAIKSENNYNLYSIGDISSNCSLTWEISSDLANRQPTWDPFKTSIPLKLDDVQTISLNLVKDKFKDGERPKIYSISLLHFPKSKEIKYANKWFYLIELQSNEKEVSILDKYIVVLFDKTIVYPYKREIDGVYR